MIPVLTRRVVSRSWPVLLVLPFLLIAPDAAQAFEARVAFRPTPAAAGHTMRIRFDDGPWETPVDLGSIAPGSDGIARVVVEGLPLGPDIHFALRAYDADGDSSVNSNQLVLTYADAARVIDSDGDGLTDAQEDTDLDGTRDGGETDPHDADSDGDGIGDGAEVEAGTDPLTPNVPAGCGDGIVQTGEACDDGNESDTDACLNDCRRATCGDGRVRKGVEQCDDGNRGNNDACLNDCQSATCGDGVVRSDVEDCDDGAANSDIADGACRTDCTLPECSIAAAAASCNDDDVCTLDVCAGGSCGHEPSRADCDDGVACTSSDVCAAGVCMGVDACEDGKICNRQSGDCQRAAETKDGLWMPAALYPSAEFGRGMVTSADFTAGDDADPQADSLSPLLLYADPDAAHVEPTEYVVTLPRSGQWYLWGRFYYPGAVGSNDANSFAVSIDGAEQVLRFGNNRDYFRRWHWDGDGMTEQGAPSPLALGALSAGPHRIGISKRETIPESPRLDMLFITDDPDVVATDDAAIEALEICPFGGCEGGPICGDATRNRRLSLTDAWTILNTAVGLGAGCRLSACDVDADGEVEALDAMSVMRATVGLAKEAELACRPSVAFGVSQANGVERIELKVEYENANIDFGSAARDVRCYASIRGRETKIEAGLDATAAVLTLAVEPFRPIDGAALLAECFASPPAGSQLPGPGAFAVAVTGVTVKGGGSSSAVVEVLSD